MRLQQIVVYEDLLIVFACYFYLFFFLQVDYNALNAMPIEVTDGIKEYRIWSVANQKCLVLKKNNSVVNVTCTGVGVEDGNGDEGSSKSQLFFFALFTCSLTSIVLLKSTIYHVTTGQRLN